MRAPRKTKWLSFIQRRDATSSATSSPTGARQVATGLARGGDQANLRALAIALAGESREIEGQGSEVCGGEVCRLVIAAVLAHLSDEGGFGDGQAALAKLALQLERERLGEGAV